LLRPGFVDPNLGILFARRVHKIHFRIKEINVADESAIEESAPLHREINQGCGKEWDRHVPSRFYDLDMMDLISATQRCIVTAATWPRYSGTSDSFRFT